MKVTVMPRRLKGCLIPPVSKSHAQRLLLAAALTGKETHILCPDASDDILTMAECLQNLGAGIKRTGEGWHVIHPVSRVIDGNVILDCRESGAVLRMLMPLCAALQGEISVTGKPVLSRRPMGPLLTALRENGAVIRGKKTPFRISGGLKSGIFTLPGNESSQYFSGLMFTLPLLPGDSRIEYLPPLVSRPYIALTLQVLRQFGIWIDEAENGWWIPGGQQYVSPGILQAEKDASAAAYFLGANYLGGQITVNGLNADSLQADGAMETWLGQIGGTISLADCPDLAPILSVCAAAEEKETKFTSVSRLRFKESDRVESITKMIKALGGDAFLADDILTVRGGKLTGGIVDPCGDHRIAMSAAIAAAACTQPVTILDAECVNKSYSRFFEDLEKLGGVIRCE